MEKRTRDYKKNGSKKMSKQGKGLILALLAFLLQVQLLNYTLNGLRYQ